MKSTLNFAVRFLGFQIRLVCRQQWRLKVDPNGQESKNLMSVRCHILHFYVLGMILLPRNRAFQASEYEIESRKNGRFARFLYGCKDCLSLTKVAGGCCTSRY